MTITSEFTGTENYAERMAGLEAIHDWWFGAGSFAAAATLGQVRANLNTLLVGTTILNRETFATWLSKVNTLNEPTDYAAALTFGESQSGALWRGTLPASLRAATDGTGEAAIGGTIARINDSSGNALHLTQASTSLRPIRGRRPKTGRRNLLAVSEGTISAYLSKANVTDAAVPIPGFANGVQFGDNSVDRYAYHTAAVADVQNTLSAYVEMDDGMPPVIGTTSAAFGDFSLAIGAARVTTEVAVEHISGGLYRVSGARTPTTSGGGCGLIKYAAQSARGFRMSGLQLELGAEVTPYQKASSAYDVTETGVESVTYAAFDLVDDALTTGAIAGGLTGQAFVAGDGGCYVSDLSIAPGGTFGIGRYPAQNWSGAPFGILRAVTGGTGRVLDAMIREGAFTEDEIARLERYYRALGGKGLLVPGPELVVNGGFDTDLTGWSNSSDGTGSVTYSSGAVALEGTNASNRGRIVQNVAVVAGMAYRVSADVLSISGGIGIKICPPGEVVSATGADADLVSGQNEFAYIAQPGDSRFVVWTGGTGGQITIDNVSIRPLIPREDL